MTKNREGKDKVHLYSAKSCICCFSGAVITDRVGVQCTLQPKRALTDFGLQPYSRK